MVGDAGRFDAHDLAAAVLVFDRVLEHPGRWCNLVFEPIQDEDAPQESPLFGLFAARGPANPLATLMTPKKEVGYLLDVGIQHRAGTKAAVQLREAELFGPKNARVVQDHPRRGLVVRWPLDGDTGSLANWLFPAMRELSRAPSTNSVLWELSE